MSLLDLYNNTTPQQLNTGFTSLLDLQNLQNSMATPLFVPNHTPSPTLTEEKQMWLQARTAEKMAKLAPDATAAQLQQALSDAVDAQVFTNPDGTKYTIDYQPAVDKFGEPTVNQVRVPYTAVNEYGQADTQHLYIDNTAQGNMKLGLAATGKGGFEGRYDPAKGGWATGPLGVTAADGALMDIELPFNKAAQFEYNVHTNKGQVANRAATAANKTAFGSGYSEYTTQEAPLWSGKDANRFDAYKSGEYIMKDPILHDVTYTPTTVAPTFKNPTDAEWDAITGGSTKSSRAVSALSSIPASFAGGVADIADAATDLVLWTGKKALDAVGVENVSKQTLDKWAVTRRKDGSLDSNLFEGGKEVFDKMLGVDSSRIQAEQKVFTDQVKEAIFNDKLSNTDKMIEVGKAVADNYKIIPEAIGASLGYLGTLFLGAGAKVGTVEAGTRAEAALNFLNQTGNINSKQKAAMAATATKASAGPITPLAAQKIDQGYKAVTLEGIPAVLSQANQTMEERRKNNSGEAADALDVLNIVASSYAGVKMDQIVDKSILAQTNQLTKAVASVIPASIKTVEQEVAKATIKDMASAIGTFGVNTSFDTVKEGLTEGLQEALIIYGERFGTADFKDKEWLGIGDNKSLNRLVDAVALGSISGTGMSVIGGAKDAFSGTAKVLASATSPKAPAEPQDVQTIEEGYVAPEVDETPATPAERDSVRNDFLNLTSKLKTVQIIGEEDLDSITKIEAVVDRYPEGTKEERDAKGKARASVVEAKKQLFERFMDTEDLSSFQFGATSKSMTPEQVTAKTHDFIFDAVDSMGGEISEAMSAKLQQVAEMNGMSSETYVKTVKAAKSAAQVEMEATTGPLGYKTYAKQLSKLVSSPVPDTGKISTLTNKIKGFKESQYTYAKALSGALQDVETLVNTYNKSLTSKMGIKSEVPKAKYEVVIPQKKSTSAWVIHVKKQPDGTYAVDPASRSMIETKENNVAELAKILARHTKAAPKAETETVKKPRTRKQMADELDKPMDKDKEDKLQKAADKETEAAKADKVKEEPKLVKEPVVAPPKSSKKIPTVKMDDKAVRSAANKAAEMHGNGATIEDLLEDKDVAGLYSQFTAKYTPEEVDAKFETYVAKVYDARMAEAMETARAYKEEEAKGEVSDKTNKAYEKLSDAYKEEANDRIDMYDVSMEEYSDLVVEFKKYIKDGETVKAAKLLEEDANAVVKDILDTSSSKGLPAVYVITKDGKRSVKLKMSNTAENDVGTPITTQELDINKIVALGEANILNSIKVADMGNTVTDYLKLFKTKLAGILQPKVAITLRKVGEANAKGKSLFPVVMHDDPARGLLYTVDIDGKEVINDNVLLALRLAMDEFVAFNSNMLDTRFKSDEDIARMFGIDSHSVDNKLRKFANDKGMFQKTLGNSIAKAALSKLGLSSKKDIDPETFNKLTAALGNVPVQYILQDTHFEQIKSNSAEVAAHMGIAMTPEEYEVKSKMEVMFIRLKPRENKPDGTNSVTEFVKQVKQSFVSIHDHVADELVFRKEPKTRPIKKSKHAGKVAKSKVGAVTSAKVEKIMEGLRAIKWDVDFDVLNDVLGHKLEGDENVYSNEENLKEWLGFTEDPIALDKMSYYDKDGQVSRNRDILKSIDELKKVLEAGSSKLFFDWFYSSNGRYMMDSNTINPQTDKLHRFIINPIARKVRLNRHGNQVRKWKTDITAEFDYAMAQAFGFAVDKGATKEILAIGEALRTTPELVAVIREALDSHEEFEVVANGKTYKLEPDHIAHAYQGLDTLVKFHAGEPFFTSLTAETDAVTSGFALKLRQLPILGENVEDMMRWLNKTGTFRFKDLEALGLDPETASMNDALQVIKDSYQELSAQVDVTTDYAETMYRSTYKKSNIKFDRDVFDTLSKILPKMEDGVVTKELRTLFKDPFMTFNYSAGMKSIRASLTDVITNKVVTAMINSRRDSKDAKSADAYLMLDRLAYEVDMPVDELRKELYSKPLNMIGNSIKAEKLLNQYIDASYGAKVEDIMSTEFKEFIEAQTNVNDAFKAMFMSFDIQYQAAVKAVITEKQTITVKDKLDIITALRKKFPAIKGPLSEESEEASYVHIYKTKSVSPGVETNLTAAQTHIQGKVATSKIAHEIKVFEAAMSAGSVVPIHFIDGAIMGKLLEASGYNLTAIHDAIMMQLGDINKGAKEYNKLYKEVSEEYSFIAEIQKQLGNLDVDALEEVDSKALDVVYKKATKTTPEITVRNFMLTLKEDFTVLSDKVATRRAELKEALAGNTVYMHMAAMSDGKYVDGKIGSVKIPKAVVTTAIVKVIKGLKYTTPSTTNAINVLRMYGTNVNKHYGNPFGTTAYGASAEVPNQGTDKEVTIKYIQWIKGEAFTDVAQDRREWIVDNIKRGILDGKELMYFKESPVNHAKALAALVNDKSWLRQTHSTNKSGTTLEVNALFTVAKDSETVYNAGTKEALLLLIKSHKGIQSTLARANIDITGC